MTANTTVKTAAATNTQMDDDNLNPTVEGSSGGRKIVHITLIADGVDITPDDVYDALDTEFAVVAGEKDTMTRGTWIFNIGPA